MVFGFLLCCGRRRDDGGDDLPKLMVAFDKPEHGWSRLQLHCDEAQLSEPFSHIYPTLRELCGALCDLLTGHTSRPVVFLLEPAELELTLTFLDGGMTRLRLRMFESRVRTSDVDAVFEFEGEPTEIALAFWRALRRLQTDLPEADFEEGWRDPFPALEMASLTELLSQRGLVLERNRRT